MGGFLKAKYAELRCRQCKLSFCCKNCRLKHEQREHGYNLDCSICLYGKIPISGVKSSEALQLHIQEKHLPLHCVKCGIVMNSLLMVDSHNFACAGKPPQVPPPQVPPPQPTPVSNKEKIDPQDLLSPEMIGLKQPDQDIITSTPTEEAVNIQVPIHITPVENNENKPKIDNKSAKRVTFYATPALENIQRKRKNPENFLKSSLKNSMRLNGDTFISAKDNMSDRESSATKKVLETIHSSAEERVKVVDELKEINFNKGSNNTLDNVPIEPIVETCKKIKRYSHSMNETLWMSAVNESVNADQDKVHNMSLDSDDADFICHVQDAGTSYDAPSKKAGVWASMTSMFSNVMKSFNRSAVHVKGKSRGSLKRSRSMSDSISDVEEHPPKKIKIADLKCRPPIRQCYKRLVPKVNVAIQTDFDDEN